MLLSIPPDAAGDPVLALLPMLRRLKLRWAGYLSSTGVYGDTGGGWVDESSPCRPDSERGRRRLEAERAWLASGLPVEIFRLSGIYGPGRNALLDVKAGLAKRIFKENQFFSRIHVGDIARVLLASIEHPSPGEIWNVADDLPAPAHEVVAYASTLLGRDPPPLIALEEAGLSPMARSFYDSSRRTSNRKIREKLGVTLVYPDYHTGLEALKRHLVEDKLKERLKKTRHCKQSDDENNGIFE